MTQHQSEICLATDRDSPHLSNRKFDQKRSYCPMQMMTSTHAAATRNDPGLSQLIEKFPVPIYVTDKEGVVTHFNRACIRFAGRTPQVGRDQWCVTWELYNSNGRYLPHDQCALAVALREKRSVRGVNAVALRPDGTRVAFTPLPTPILGRNGVLNSVVNMMLVLPQRQVLEFPLDFDQVPFRNQILKRLGSPSFAWDRVTLEPGEILAAPHTLIKNIYFLESGVASVYLDSRAKEPEVALIGNEGMTGHSILLGLARSPYLTVMRMPGRGVRVSVEEIRRMVDLDGAKRDRLLGFVNHFTMQVLQTASANARLSTVGRVARWLLMVTDRTSQHLSITHDTVATAIGARRAGATMAMHELEGAKALRARRSEIIVLDRGRLVSFAAGSDPGYNRVNVPIQ